MEGAPLRRYIPDASVKVNSEAGLKQNPPLKNTKTCFKPTFDTLRSFAPARAAAKPPPAPPLGSGGAGGGSEGGGPGGGGIPEAGGGPGGGGGAGGGGGPPGANGGAGGAGGTGTKQKQPMNSEFEFFKPINVKKKTLFQNWKRTNDDDQRLQKLL